MRKILILMLSLLSGTILAQKNFSVKILDPSASFYSIAEDNDKNLIFIGLRQIKDLYLLKLSPKGDYIWSKSISDSMYSIEGDCIIRCSDGNFAIVGSMNNINDFSRKAFVIKIDSAGNILWSKVYTQFKYSASQHSIKEDKNGNLIISGESEKEKNNITYIYLGYIKTDSEGKVIETYEFDAYKSYNIDLMCSVETPEGGKVIVGTDMTVIGGPMSSIVNMYADSLLIIKINSKGEIEWKRNLGKTSIYQASIVNGENGNYLIKLGSNILICISRNGELQFKQDFNADCYSSDLVQTNDGGALCYGHSYKSIEGQNYTQSDILIIKLKSDGSVDWQNTYGNPYNDDFVTAWKEVDGGYIFVSRDLDEKYYKDELSILKFDYNGNNLTKINSLDVRSEIKISLRQNSIRVHDQFKFNSDYEIINISGQILKKGKVSENADIQLPKLKDGIYLLKLVNSGKMYTAKFAYKK